MHMEKTDVIEGFYSLKGGEFEDAGAAAKELRKALARIGVSKENIKRASEQEHCTISWRRGKSG
jgi:hypothetical protein